MVKALVAPLLCEGQTGGTLKYYQGKYDEVEGILKRHDCVLAKDVCSLINYGTVPTSPYTDDGSGTPYIKGLNLKGC